MTNRDRFVRLVTLYITLDNAASLDDPTRGVAIVSRAMDVPEWAPRLEDVRAEGGWPALVETFVKWNQSSTGYTTPEWYYRAVGPSFVPPEKRFSAGL